MGCTSSTMRLCSKFSFSPLWVACLIGVMPLGHANPVATAACHKPVYLTFDTGHMGVADLIADVLKRQQVKATFFVANEKTLNGGTTLDAQWLPWWRERIREGHAFGSHTFDHVYWRADAGLGRYRVRPSSGPQAGQEQEWTQAQYCAEIERVNQVFREQLGRPLDPLFRAPGGKTSAALLATVQQCGWRHVAWAAAGFLGDELPSDRYPNQALLQRALRDIRAGDILMAHLGIWSRQDPWAPAVLEPLIQGLKAKGFCFATLADPPKP